MLNDVGAFCSLSIFSGFQTLWSRDSFIFLKNIENPRELLFVLVIVIDIYETKIKTQTFKKHFNN